MKSEHVVLVAATLYVAFLGYAAGAISTSVATAAMPHGTIEYFLERYQSAWVGGFALVGLAIAAAQLTHTRVQNLRTMQLSTEPERRALNEVIEYSAFVLERKPQKPVDDWQLADVPASVGHYWDTRQFPFLERELDPELLIIFHQVSTGAQEYTTMQTAVGMKEKEYPDDVLLRQYKWIIHHAEVGTRKARKRLRELESLISPDTIRHG